MASERKVTQLSARDAVFLSMDTDTTWGHVGGLCVLDPSTATDFSFERMLERVAERIELVPRFRWKLREVGLGLDEPYWVEAEDFDIHDHVHHIAVPAPGTMREVSELVGLLYARPLDRARPLWEMWIIEGLENGRIAEFMKTHHCLMDGQGGTGLSEVMSDLTPDASGPIEIPEALEEAPPRPPSETQVVTNAWRHVWDRSRNTLHYLRGAASEAISDRLHRREAFDPPTPGDVPWVSFNGVVGSQRAFSFTSIPLDRVKAIKKGLDVTVNDVVLELVGSVVRRYLHARGELPEVPLVACLPVSIRKAGDQRLGNQITNMAVSLETDLGHPAERLRRIHRGVVRAREKLSEGHVDLFGAIGESLAPFAVHALMEISSSEATLKRLPLQCNFVVSNVRGTQAPLYTAGAKIESMYPLSMVQSGQGLNVTVFSYAGRVDFGFTVDPHLLPDYWGLAEGVEPALVELEEDLERLTRRER